MKYFIDTEFIENGSTIDMISIGIAAEDGREYYAERSHVPWHRADPWVVENVKLHLKEDDLKSQLEVAEGIYAFCNPDNHGKPEFWGYYADYDWVVFCQLFGRMIDLPKGFPMYCNDIKQLAMSLGNPKLPEQSTTEHHALADARWNKEVYDFLKSGVYYSNGVAK
jgi:hypothetical protein